MSQNGQIDVLPTAFALVGEPCTDVMSFLRTIFSDGQPHEVRVLNCPSKFGGDFFSTHAGYFTSPEAAAKAVANVERLAPPAVYVTLNPCIPDVVARSRNKLKSKVKNTTSDNEVVARRWLLVDIDPTRPAGVSSTDEEMQDALNLANKVRHAMAVEGWPAPIIGMSGNGAYLLWRIDLPNDDAARELCRRVLLGLKQRFDTDAAKVDQSTFNAARIAKVLGTVARKGDNTDDRPHRRSWFIAPEHELSPVSEEMLQAAAIQETKVAHEQPPGHNGKPHSNGRMSVAERCQKYLATMPDSIEGQHGSDRCIAAACKIWQFTDNEADAWALLQWFNTNKTSSKWSDKELEHKLADARKKVEADGKIGCMATDKRETSIIGKTSEGSPRIAVCDDLKKMTEAAWEALKHYNRPAPRVFRYGGLPARLETDDNDQLVVSTLNIDGLRYEAVQAAEWVRRVQKADETVDIATSPSDKLVKNLLATPDKPLPILTRLVQAPVFAKDGALQVTPGYHARGRVYYRPAPGFSVPKVAERPTDDDVREARRWICEELLVDFPFVGNAEIAHAVALMLLPFARDLIDGPTPFHLVEKPSPGTGASLMVEMLAYPILGTALNVGTEVRSEDEMRKRITATLMNSPAYFLLDNLNRLDSASLSAVLTAQTWTDRELQYSRTVTLPVRCCVVGTGNNPTISKELARRSVRIRLDAKHEKPWERTEFKHKDLRGWVARNRAKLVWSALTLIQAWLSKGRPEPDRTLGSYEPWSRVIGGTLMVAGIDGFLGNLAEFYTASDEESETWRSFLADWWSEKCSHEVKTSDLIPLAIRNGVNLGDKEGHSQVVKLGKKIHRYVETIFTVPGDGDNTHQVMIEKGEKSRRANTWTLSELTETSF